MQHLTAKYNVFAGSKKCFLNIATKTCFNCHLKEGNHEVEDEPNVNHLDVGGLWEVFRDSDEHCCQNLGK